jgi:eukaryotic-like serine/threonine-protein kinase
VDETPERNDDQSERRRDARLRSLVTDSIGALRTLANLDDPSRPLPAPELPLALGSIDGDGRADYRLVEQVGEGQSARVYRAVVERMSDGTHRREVAVKLFRAMTEPSHFDAVRAEALRADRVRSPHIVRVFDVGLWEGRHPYVVQDFHDSVHLETWADDAFVEGKSPPSIELCVRMVLQVARGLVEAHAQDLIHRDIAPRNILIGRDGLVRITDFGCAGFGESASNETVVGTPGFMPPEQWRSGAQLKQSDLASLAGVLYWLLTGHLPYGATRQEILASHAAPAIAQAKRSIELANSEVPPP